MRSTSATALLNNGMDVCYISKILGHNEIRTTQRYLHINLYDLKAVMSKKHPRLFIEKKGENNVV